MAINFSFAVMTLVIRKGGVPTIKAPFTGGCDKRYRQSPDVLATTTTSPVR